MKLDTEAYNNNENLRQIYEGLINIHPILSFGKISGLTENSLFYKFLLIGKKFLTYVYVEQKFMYSKRNLE